MSGAKPYFIQVDVHDPIVAQVIDELASRDNKGYREYNMTTADKPLDIREWLQHALEETLDQAVYLRRAIRELDNLEAGQCPSSPIFESVIRTKLRAMGLKDSETLFDGGSEDNPPRES